MFATATVVAFIPFRDSRFNFHCYTQREATPTQKSARKCAATSRDFLRERSQSAFTLANQLRWIAQYAILILTNRTQLCHATDLPNSHAQLKGGGGEKGKEGFPSLLPSPQPWNYKHHHPGRPSVGPDWKLMLTLLSLPLRISKHQLTNSQLK